MLASVDIVMGVIGQEIAAAWLRIAPSCPDQPCRIVVPIPADVFDVRRGSRQADLLAAVSRLPMVEAVQMEARIPDGAAGECVPPSWPALVITGRPYDAMREMDG